MPARTLTVLALALLLIGAAVRTASAEDFYLPPEHFGAARSEEFLAHAQEYLAQHPTAENSPRVASDLLMMATLTRNQPLAEQAKRRLLLDYPGSLYTQWLLAGIGQANDLRKILQGALDDPQQEFQAEFCRAFCGAVRAGGQRFGNALLADDDFVLACTLMAKGAGDSQLLVALRTLIGRGMGASKETAAIAFDRRLDGAERVTRLHNLRKNKGAKLAERYFHARLTAEERDEPQILKLTAENHLERRAFAEALPLVEKLSRQESDPQTLFWRAWCLAALNRKDEIPPVLAELDTNHAGNPWQELGAELPADLEQLDATLENHAAVLAAAVKHLRDDGPELFELRCELETSDGRQYELTAGFDAGRQYAEGLLSQQGETVMAGRVLQGTARLYIQGESAIQEFPAAGSVPALPSLNLSRLEDGRFHLATAAAQPGLAGLEQTRTALFESPWLSTPSGLVALLKSSLAHGAVARPVVDEDDGGRTLVWVRPRIDRAEWQTLSIHIDRDGRIKAVRAEDTLELDLRHGPAGAFQLAQPDWPDVPVEPREKIDPATWLRMLAAAVSVFSNQTNGAQP